MFDEIKEYLSKPPVLVPPQQDRPFYIYLSVGDTSIASVAVQVHDGLERVIFEDVGCENQVPQHRKIMSLFVLYLLEASAHFVFCGDRRHLQIGCHQAYAVGARLKGLTREMDIRVVRV